MDTLLLTVEIEHVEETPQAGLRWRFPKHSSTGDACWTLLKLCVETIALQARVLAFF